jgi:hypothetical protein
VMLCVMQSRACVTTQWRPFHSFAALNKNLTHLRLVPNELKPSLVRPFLNDKAKGLIAQKDPDVIKDYEQMRNALLREFQLTPNSYS